MNKKFLAQFSLVAVLIIFMGGFLLHFTPTTSAAEGANTFDLNSPEFQNILGNAIVAQTQGQLNGIEESKAETTRGFRQIFIFMMGLVGASAFVMITIGGIEYATSGGNKSRIDSAKQKIRGSIVGIILAGSSVLILQTINPDFVNFNLNTTIKTSPTGSVLTPDFERSRNTPPTSSTQSSIDANIRGPIESGEASVPASALQPGSTGNQR